MNYGLLAYCFPKLLPENFGSLRVGLAIYPQTGELNPAVPNEMKGGQKGELEGGNKRHSRKSVPFVFHPPFLFFF